MIKENAKERHMNFWNKFIKTLEERKISFYVFVPQSGNSTMQWIIINDDTDNFRGNPKITIKVDVDRNPEKARVSLYMPGNEKMFNNLLIEREQIEKEYAEKLEWDDSPKRDRYISKTIEGHNYNNELEFDELVNILIETTEKFIKVFEKRIEPYINERGKITASMKVNILTRDKYTCQYCGASAPNVELHVDHIIPIFRDGKSEISNLQTLCRDCNLGKSSRIVEQKENYFDFLSEDTLKKLAELKKIMGKDFEEKIENGIVDFIEIQKEMYTMIE